MKKKSSPFIIVLSASFIILTTCTFLQNPPNSLKQANRKEKIASAQALENCTVQVTTQTGEKAIVAKFWSLGFLKRPDCIQKFNREISPSQKYLAFEDVSGGIDSVIRTYSIILKKTTTLGIWGTSTIMDFKFLPNDKLAILNGYPGIFDEQWLVIYDLPGLYGNYQENISKYGDNDYFETVGFEKDLDLKDIGKNYTHLKVNGTKLKVFAEDSGTTPVVEYEI